MNVVGTAFLIKTTEPARHGLNVTHRNTTNITALQIFDPLCYRQSIRDDARMPVVEYSFSREQRCRRRHCPLMRWSSCPPYHCFLSVHGTIMKNRKQEYSCSWLQTILDQLSKHSKSTSHEYVYNHSVAPRSINVAVKPHNIHILNG